MQSFSENVLIASIKKKNGYDKIAGRMVMVHPEPAAISVDAVSKSYGATVALEAVSLQLRPGEVHALLGENGAGKSTLVKILSGVVQPNAGTMHLGGQSYTPRTILDARRLGVATAFQELSLLPNLTVAENLFLPRQMKSGLPLVSPKRTARAAEEILERYCLTGLSPLRQISSLNLAERQKLEIVRAMHHQPRLLILDEPTAALTDVDWLFSLVREMTASGTAVLYISHRLAEVRSLCQRASVLRNGRSIATVSLEDATDAQIFEMMVGRSQKSAERPASRRWEAGQAQALTVSGLCGGPLDDISLTLNRGEILGIAALEGQGQRDLFRALVGLAPVSGGEIVVDGKTVRPKSPAHALKLGNGVAFLPEDRKTEGIFTGLTAAANMALPVVGRIGRAGLVWGSRERNAARPHAEAVDFSPRYMDFRINDLSGGNQQKALLARAMMTEARTLLLYDPTRGVDVGTKQAIYEAIRRFAAEGGAVLLYSSELPELVQLVDRCLVLYGARIHAEFAGDEIEENRLVAALTGHRVDPGSYAGDSTSGVAQGVLS